MKRRHTSIGLDFHPINSIDLWFENKAIELVLQFAQAPVKAADLIEQILAILR